MSKEPSAPFFPSPLAPPAAQPPARSRTLPLVLGIGGVGCVGVILLAVVVVMAFLHAAGDCPPKDFPAYPNAQSTGFNYTSNGASSDCTAGWEADATPAEVATFYTGTLSSGPWELSSKDDQSGQWFFQRRGDPTTVGMLQFLGHGKQTRIEMEIMTGQSASPSASP